MADPVRRYWPGHDAVMPAEGRLAEAISIVAGVDVVAQLARARRGELFGDPDKTTWYPTLARVARDGISEGEDYVVGVANDARGGSYQRLGRLAIADAREAWEAFATRGLIPADWADGTTHARAFWGHDTVCGCGGTGEEYVAGKGLRRCRDCLGAGRVRGAGGWPPTLGLAITLAADAPGMLAAEQLLREHDAQARRVVWHVEHAPSVCVRNVIRSDRERVWERWLCGPANGPRGPSVTPYEVRDEDDGQRPLRDLMRLGYATSVNDGGDWRLYVPAFVAPTNYRWVDP